GRGVQWDSRTPGAGTREIDKADAVINLAGENVGARWTAARRRRILSSRIDATTALVEALKRAPSRSRSLVSASAVGFYGFTDEDVKDESSPNGSGFLAEVTAAWERA